MFYTCPFQRPGPSSSPVERRSRETPNSHQHWIRETYHLLGPLEFQSGTPATTPLCLFYSACLGGLRENEKERERLEVWKTLCANQGGIERPARVGVRQGHGGGTLHWQSSSTRQKRVFLTASQWDLRNKTLIKNKERKFQHMSLCYLPHWKAERVSKDMFSGTDAFPHLEM